MRLAELPRLARGRVSGTDRARASGTARVREPAADTEARRAMPKAIQGSGRGPAAPVPEPLASALLEPLFDGREDQRLTVLDLGPAVGETVAFFGQYRCRLQFVDLVGETLEAEGASGADGSGKLTIPGDMLERLLDFPAETRFDVCLFWDLLNYLDRGTLAVFNRKLRPYLHPDTRAHGFGIFQGTTAVLDRRFGIRSIGEIVARPRVDQPVAAHAHSQRTLANGLTAFEIRRTTLSNDGRLEFLMLRK